MKSMKKKFAGSSGGSRIPKDNTDEGLVDHFHFDGIESASIGKEIGGVMKEIARCGSEIEEVKTEIISVRAQIDTAKVKEKQQLRAEKERLQIKEQQLRAEEQQLRAEEQQLRTEKEQLRTKEQQLRERLQTKEQQLRIPQARVFSTLPSLRILHPPSAQAWPKALVIFPFAPDLTPHIIRQSCHCTLSWCPVKWTSRKLGLFEYRERNLDYSRIRRQKHLE